MKRLKWTKDFINKVIQGDALEVMRQIPDESIDMAMTSPPYYGLRDYGKEAEIIWGGDKKCDHEWSNKIVLHDNLRPSKVGPRTTVGSNKNLKFRTGKQSKSNFCSLCGAWKGQLGLEPSFDLYIKHLCDILNEVKRVLRKDGTCWINMGDTYNAHSTGNGNVGGIEKENKPLCDIQAGNNRKINLPDKSLCNIPARFSIEMQNRGWILRNVIIWHKPNCMPSSVKDRFTIDFEYLFFFVKNKKYWFETQYEKLAESTLADPRLDKGLVRHKSGKSNEPNSQYAISGMCANSIGRNKRAVWTITTKPFKEAHFAVYPEELCETPIKAGCPEFVCKKCGKPVMKKVIGKKGFGDSFNIRVRDMQTQPQKWGKLYKASEDEKKKYNEREYRHKTTREKTVIKCDCNAGFKPGIVLDIFAGSGTTGVVAKKLGRRYILIELKPEYCEIARERLKSA